MSLTRILIDSSLQTQIQDADYQLLYNNARSVQFGQLLASYLNSLLTLEPFLLQQKLAFTQKFLSPSISIHTGHGTGFHPATLRNLSPTLLTMSLTRILIDSSLQTQIQDADYQLYNNARSVQFDEYLAFYLNSLLTFDLEPSLLQQKLAFTQNFLLPGISIHTGHGTVFQPDTIPSPLSHQGDNDVLHTSETPAHNVRSMEMNSTSDPEQVGTQGHAVNLPTIDVTSETESMGSLFDQIIDYTHIPPQTPQHVSTPVPSCFQDRNNHGTLSRDISSAQNIPSIELGSNMAVTDYNMEQVDTPDHRNSPWSVVDVTPDLAHMSDSDRILNNRLDLQGFNCSSTVENTDHDSLSCSGLAASASIGQSPLTVSTSECYTSSHDMGECMRAGSHPGDAAGVESYPTPVSNPSHTPKLANRVPKGKRRKVTKGKANREDSNVLSPLARRDPSPSNEANSAQLDLLKRLASRARLVSDDETLLTIHEVGVQIVSGTYAILNGWSEWLSQELQPALFPPYRSLSTLGICMAASRILVEPKDGDHCKSIHRRLAQILLNVFVAVYKKELEVRETNGETFQRTGRKPITIAHDMVVESVGSVLWDRTRVVNNKNYGKRWWRLGSGIGIITVLTCPPDSVIGDMEDRTFNDHHIKLLVNYVRNVYPNAVAHFQSLDPIIQSLFVNHALLTTAPVRLDRLHSQFSTLPEQVQCLDTDKAMEAATESLLRIFRQD